MKALSVTASFSIALAIALGAFGAHGLRGLVPVTDLAIWETAVLYHLVNSVGLFALSGRALSAEQLKGATRLGWLLVGSMAVFSGSLYTLVLTNQRWLGAVTPIGGLGFIVSWILIGLLLSRSAPRN